MVAPLVTRRGIMVMDDCSKTQTKYVSKVPYDGRKSTNELVVIEHIANTLYYLFGVATPNLYIIAGKGGVPTLMSQILPGYKDFSDVMGGSTFINALAAIDEPSAEKTIAKRIEFFNCMLHQMDINIVGREALLIASILLKDIDVLGRGMDNIGLIPTPTPNEFQLVKIDQAGAEMTSFDDFKESIDIELPLLSKDYSGKLLNLGKTFLGPLHYLEFFDGIEPSKVKFAIDMIRGISDEEIKKHVCRKEYLQLVEPAYLEKIASTIIARKNYLVSLFKQQGSTVERTAVVSKFFRPACHFSKPLREIKKGASDTYVTLEEVGLNKPTRTLETVV